VSVFYEWHWTNPDNKKEKQFSVLVLGVTPSVEGAGDRQVR